MSGALGTVAAQMDATDPTDLADAELAGSSSTFRAAANGPALTVDAVTCRIDGHTIVDRASLDVGKGELFVLVGPSGCGKSTLLRMIAGLGPAASGRVLLGKDDISAEPPERRRIGLVFQDHALFPHRRIDQNIAFGLTHLSRSERARRVVEMLDLVRLPDMAKRYPHELSGGEQQRAALARALAPDPAVVLLDEPFASLDPTLREEVRHDVVSALRARGAAAILVTHDRDEALALGDRVAVMHHGEILQIGTPDEVYEHPVDRFVAEFMGEASFLSDGTMARPHDLSVEPDGPDVVTGRRYLGARWRYDVQRADGSIVHVEHATDPAVPTLPIGASCRVVVAASHPLHQLRPDEN